MLSFWLALQKCLGHCRPVWSFVMILHKILGSSVQSLARWSRWSLPKSHGTNFAGKFNADSLLIDFDHYENRTLLYYVLWCTSWEKLVLISVGHAIFEVSKLLVNTTYAYIFFNIVCVYFIFSFNVYLVILYLRFVENNTKTHNIPRRTNNTTKRILLNILEVPLM